MDSKNGVADGCVWGDQLEVASSVSSYIPATDCAAYLIAVELGGFRLYTEGVQTCATGPPGANFASQPFRVRLAHMVNPLLARLTRRVQTQPFRAHKARRVQTQPFQARKARQVQTQPFQVRKALRVNLSLARKARRVQTQPFRVRMVLRVNPLLARKARRVQTQPFRVRLAPLELTVPRRGQR